MAILARAQDAVLLKLSAVGIPVTIGANMRYSVQFHALCWGRLVAGLTRRDAVTAGQGVRTAVVIGHAVARGSEALHGVACFAAITGHYRQKGPSMWVFVAIHAVVAVDAMESLACGQTRRMASGTRHFSVQSL